MVDLELDFLLAAIYRENLWCKFQHQCVGVISRKKLLVLDFVCIFDTFRSTMLMLTKMQDELAKNSKVGFYA